MDNKNECNHATLTKLGGPLHADGQDYYCKGCGQHFSAEAIIVGVVFGTDEPWTQADGPDWNSFRD